MAQTDALRQAVTRRGQEIFERARETMERALQREISDNAKHPYATGLTAERTSVRTVGTGQTLAALAESTTPQAGYTDKGTKPHVIRPRGGPVLVFEGNDGPVFTRVVHHPGTRATNWLSGTVKRWPQMLRDAQRSA